MNEFLTEAQEIFDFTRFLRRDFHRHPELGFQEVRTAGIVTRTLTELGLEVASGVGKTGVVALLEGSQPGPVVMMRFDMDALPITEDTRAEYASLNSGVMHACGHDAHVAIGLTVARLLAAHRKELRGSYKFVFQPAEEGLGGAEGMISAGALENPKPDYALGLHVWNEKPFGWVGVTPGPVMAAAEIFQMKITGKGGHGAVPNLTVDPVIASAQVLTALQTIVSRNVSPLQTAVVSVTSIHGGTAFNVIPPQVEMQGTLRSFEPEVRERILTRFDEIVSGVAKTMGCQVEITMKSLTPAVVNDRQVSERVQASAKHILASDQLDVDFRTMGSEDMAFFLQRVPGCFIFIGSSDPSRGLDAPHHHPKFDIDEQVMPRAAALVAGAAVDLAVT